VPNMPTVIIAYAGFTNTAIEEEVLSAIDATVLQTGTLSTPEARQAVQEADALMVTLENVSAELLGSMKRCRIVSRLGIGIDNIDVPAATERGIWVTNVPDYAVDEVSTHVIALLLAHARRLPQIIDVTRRGTWAPGPARPLPRLKGQTLGLLGFGRIGRAVAAKAQGLGLEVIACDTFVDAEVMEAAGVRPVDWQTLLRTSDYISLHAPLTDKTRQIVDAEALSLMKPTAFLINTARGALVDEEALLRAIHTNHQIAGAALDVLTVEPPPAEHPLLHEERVWVTPHLAWYSEEAEVDLRVRAAEEVVRVLRGDKPRSPVNQIE
jgi:D-3-phosphoglycerate dehydrogenase